MTKDARASLVLCAAMFLVYNANGREIGSYDSQPTKYAARELLLRGTLGLNHVVGRVPELADRSGFVLARDGRYRSAYSPVPAIAAAAIAWPLVKSGALDLRAPGAPTVIAVGAASLLTALATVLLFLTARRVLPFRSALLIALGAGLGTGLWSTASQTLWQHETAIFGLAVAAFAFCRPVLRVRDGMLVGVGLALACGSRPQLAPIAAVLLAGLFARGGWRAGVPAAAIAGAAAAALVRVNLLWFGQPLGAAPMLEALHDTVHATTGTFRLNAEGLAGLLISPSRGLFVFSPVAMLALCGLRRTEAAAWRGAHLWLAAAAAAQYVLYGSYTVWWGGHTYGPRYMLDVLPLLVPSAAVGARCLVSRWTRASAAGALAWSVGVAALGAFCYPHDAWNTDPVSVDRHHARLWDWSDSQIRRCWTRGASPQNYSLFTRASFRADTAER